MATRRPAYTSIRARQIKLLEFENTTGLSPKQAASYFNVKPHQYIAFTREKSPAIRRNFNRSDAYSKLFEAGQESKIRKDVRKATKGKSTLKRILANPEMPSRYVPYVDYTEAQISVYRTTPGLKEKPEIQRQVEYAELVQNLYSTRKFPRYDWAAYVSAQGLPSSIRNIQILWRNNRLSDGKYLSILNQWQQIYNIADDYYADYADEVEDNEG